MEYKEDLGEYTITYTGTPEEIAKLKYLIDNEKVVVEVGDEEVPLTIEDIKEFRRTGAFH